MMNAVRIFGLLMYHSTNFRGDLEDNGCFEGDY